MIIYKIENKINGKIYIGQSIRSLNARLAGHLKSDYHIGKALKKYGLQSFLVSIIDEADTRAVLNEKEKYWIKTYACKSPAGYNCADGGKGGGHYTPHSDEARKKIKKKRALQVITEETKQKQKDWVRTAEYKQKCRDAHMGHVVTEETRQKISETRIRKGIKHSTETLKKLSYAKKGKPSLLKGRHLSEEHIQKLKGRVYSAEIIEKYRAASLAAWMVKKQKQAEAAQEVSHVYEARGN